MALTGAPQLSRGLLSSPSLTHVRFSSAFFCFVSVLSLFRSLVTVIIVVDGTFVGDECVNTQLRYLCSSTGSSSDLILEEEFSVEIPNEKTDKLARYDNVAKYIASAIACRLENC
ncbi:hypothetical protein AHAS_Ahas05G0076900 [Arachis hypogaea]